MSEAERDALRDCLGTYTHPRWYLLCRCGRIDEDDGAQGQEEMLHLAEQDGWRVVGDEALCPGCAATRGTEQRRARWAEALRAWNGDQDALDGALARYMEGDPAVSRAALLLDVSTALAQTWRALGAVGNQLAQDAEVTKEPGP